MHSLRVPPRGRCTILRGTRTQARTLSQRVLLEVVVPFYLALAG